jgi:ABC-type glutathione transport system ATPase component
MTQPLIEVRGLEKVFKVRNGRTTSSVRAVDGVTFSVRRGETFGVVGESGSGKSTLARCVARIADVTAGQLHFDGADLLAMDRRTLRRTRRDIGFVFQNPVGALDPRMTVEDLVGEPLRTHERLRGRALTERVVELLTDVGLART